MFSFFHNNKLVDLSALNTDLHSHVLPYLDDGAKDLEESISLIKQMSDLGYKKMIVTPHVRYESFNTDTREFDSRKEELQKALIANDIVMDLEVGAEQTLDEGFKWQKQNNRLKSFGKHNYLLIELPFSDCPIDIKDTIFDLQKSGYNLILAHPERYLYLTAQENIVQYLHDANVLFQINILSLIGFYDKYVEKFCKELIKKDYVDLVGSDLHHQPHIDAIKLALKNKTLYSLIESGRLMNNKF